MFVPPRHVAQVESQGEHFWVTVSKYSTTEHCETQVEELESRVILARHVRQLELASPEHVRHKGLQSWHVGEGVVDLN